MTYRNFNGFTVGQVWNCQAFIRSSSDFFRTNKLLRHIRDPVMSHRLKAAPCQQSQGTGAKFGCSFGLTTCSRSQLKLLLLLLLLFNDLGPRPISGAGHRKLQPNLAPTPK